MKTIITFCGFPSLAWFTKSGCFFKSLSELLDPKAEWKVSNWTMSRENVWPKITKIVTQIETRAAVEHNKSYIVAWRAVLSNGERGCPERGCLRRVCHSILSGGIQEGDETSFEEGTKRTSERTKPAASSLA